MPDCKTVEVSGYKPDDSGCQLPSCRGIELYDRCGRSKPTADLLVFPVVSASLSGVFAIVRSIHSNCLIAISFLILARVSAMMCYVGFVVDCVLKAA